jgi:subtilisin family serine protease
MRPLLKIRFVLLFFLFVVTTDASAQGKENHCFSYLREIGLDHVSMKDFPVHRKILVSVIDSGVFLNHPDLKDYIDPNGKNLIDTIAPPEDDYGHGTNIAGIILKIVGTVTNNIHIIPIKILDIDGKGEIEDLTKAIIYSVDQGASVISLSLNFRSDSIELKDAISYAEEKDVVVVSSTGNKNSGVEYPASYPTVLAVGGITIEEKVAPLSNFGPEVDIVAPWKAYSASFLGKYEYVEGTSISAAQVAGVAALIRTKYPQIKASELRDLLKSTAEDIEAPGFDMFTGYGKLRADRALSRNIESE